LVASLGLLHPQILSLEAVPFKGGRSHNLGFVNGTGWATHNEGQLKQHLLIEELDKGLAALITDLESKKLLDKTLIVVATEFGRPAQFDGGGGRGHHSKCFSMVLARRRPEDRPGDRHE